MNQYEQASRIFAEILTNSPAKNSSIYISSLRELGTIALHQKNYQTAREYYFKALAAAPADKYYLLGRIARSYFLEGNYKLAEKIYRDALAVTSADDLMIPWYILRLGEVNLALGNTISADEKLQTALALAQETVDSELLWETYFAIGRLHIAQSKLQAAINAFKRALVYIEVTRKKLKIEQFRIGYFIEPNAVYEHLSEAYFLRYQTSGNKTDIDSLFYYSSFTRGRALQESVETGKGQQQFLSSNKSATRYRLLRQKVAKLQRRLRLYSAALQPIADSTLETLQTARLDMLAQKLRTLEEREKAQLPASNFTPQFTDLDSLKHILAHGNRALLHYHISDQQSFVVVITARDIATLPLEISARGLSASIEKLLRPFYNVSSGTTSRLPFHADIAFELYQHLFLPVLQKIDLPKKLIIVPDIHLAGLPFDLLLQSPPLKQIYTGADSADYQANLLLYKYVLSSSPATSVILKKHPELTASHDLLVLANPSSQSQFLQPDIANRMRYQVSRSWQFPPLIHATQEALSIKKLNIDVKVLLHGEATETAFREYYTDYSILHFATHAFVDTILVPFSGVVLALGDDSTQDGLLVGYEFAELDLNSDLVTLGACETGRGRTVEGEGVLGLPRIILAAGARSVMQTLWKIDDNFAGLMMPEFYNNYLSKNMDKAQALSVAKRQLIQKNKEYAHPFFWAGFTLYGAPGTAKPSWFAQNWLLLLSLCSLVLLTIFYFISRRTPKKKQAPCTDRI